MMCVNPTVLDNGQMAGCRKCKQCKQNRVQDWVGRCIAESKVSLATYVVTLTYGRDSYYHQDHDHAQILTYRDIQLYMKRLRKFLGPVRFFVTGEYGSAKGRAHWHIVLFWKSEKQAVPLKERFIHSGPQGQKIWPDGWSFWEEASPEAIHYACKYILKDWGPGSQSARGMSSMPPLGNDYFVSLAAEYVNNGLSPQNTAYYFAETRMRDGQLVKYLLTHAAAYNFLSAFDRLWQIRYGNRLWPQSELMDEYEDERDRRLRRSAGVADFSEYIFAGRFDLERREKMWQAGGRDVDVNSAAMRMSRENRYYRAKNGI